MAVSAPFNGANVAGLRCAKDLRSGTYAEPADRTTSAPPIARAVRCKSRISLKKLKIRTTVPRRGQRAEAACRSTWVSVAVNLVLTATQIAAGILSKSQGPIADGIHSLPDLVADLVVLFANHNSQKDADADHPYGHHRFETAASLMLGALLLAVGLGTPWSAFLKL
jgi:Co/Zn/Cd efflux system component